MSISSKPDAAGIKRTVRVVSAYVGHNHVARSDIASLIGLVFAAVNQAPSRGQAMSAAAARVPAVPIRKSITPDFIICLEDGKSFKSLKRHLATRFNLTPEQYRRKWGLPNDYPMVAASYATKRSELAIKLGLGRKAEEPPLKPAKAAIPRKARTPTKTAA